jgi:hypothetical protein
MTIEQFRSALQHTPFQPLDVHLADGRTIAIRHPEQVAMNPVARTFHVVHADGSWNVIDLLLVTDIEFGRPLEPEPPEKRAG